MVSAANLLLNAAAPTEQTQSPGGAQAAQEQDPSSSPFLALVQGLMEPAEPVDEDPMRAGQQTTEDEQSSDGGEPPKDAVLQSCLLGSVQIACSEVQALPSQVVTDVSVAKEATPATVESSRTEVAPNPAQPRAIERPAEAAPTDSPLPVEGMQSAAPLVEAAVETDPQVKDGELPVIQGKPVQVSSDVPEQESKAAVEQSAEAVPTVGRLPVEGKSVQVSADVPPQTSDPEIEQPESPQPVPKADVPDDRAVRRGTTARGHAERSELPEYLRTIVPQGDNRSASRFVPDQAARSIRTAVDVDPELAAVPVDRPEQREVGAFPPRAESRIQWMPIDVRPAVDTFGRAVAVTTPSQPVDQVAQTNIIHQIVRTAKIHVFDGGGEMVMRLEPAHLGSIRMSVTADQGVVTAHLRAGTESVRQALEAGIVALRQSLADSGIRVDSISVSVGDNLGQGWNLHAGGQNGSQHADSRQNGYPTARLSRDDTVLVDQPNAAHISAGFNYLA
jgi:hypothetical protein